MDRYVHRQMPPAGMIPSGRQGKGRRAFGRVAERRLGEILNSPGPLGKSTQTYRFGRVVGAGPWAGRLHHLDKLRESPWFPHD